MAKIITYQGSMDKLVWHKEFKGLDGDSEVIVPVAHEAVFVCDGKIIDSFSLGRYFLGESAAFSKMFENGKTINAIVYYIKKEGSYNIKWEALKPIRIDDPVLKLPVEFDIEGVFAIKIIDARQFLLKLMENTEKASLEEVKVFFKNRILFYIKDQLLAVLNEDSMSIVDAINKPVSVSKALEFKIRYLFSDFGVSVESLMLKKLSLVNAYAPTEKDLKPVLDAMDRIEKKDCCSGCGQQLPINANFCFNCGVKTNK